MASARASKVVTDTNKVVINAAILDIHLDGIVFEIVVGQVGVANEGFHVKALDWEVDQSDLLHEYVPIFSEKYSLRLNRLRQKIRIFGAL